MLHLCILFSVEKSIVSELARILDGTQKKPRKTISNLIYNAHIGFLQTVCITKRNFSSSAMWTGPKQMFTCADLKGNNVKL